MAMPNSPCFGCDKRTSTCHSSCIEYDIYKLDMAERNDVIKKAKAEERKRREYEIQNFSKRKW
jgi:hypothetical protein